jgi:glutamate--cysteine ligase
MEELAAKSLVEQTVVESSDTESFDAFIAAYQVYTLNPASA